MIVVKRITGESFDLETGSEVPRGLVLSNGSQELIIPASDEVIKSIVIMARLDGIPIPQGPSAQRLTETPPTPPGMTLAPSISEVVLDSGLTEYDDQESGLGSI